MMTVTITNAKFHEILRSYGYGNVRGRVAAGRIYYVDHESGKMIGSESVDENDKYAELNIAFAFMLNED